MEEISISLEETNKLRAQVGLPPIPSSEPRPQTEAPSSSKELSVDETNKLRISLGLKPIEVTTVKVTPENIPKKDKDGALKEKINAIRAKSEQRKKLKGKTLLDDYEEMSTDDWLDTIGRQPKPEAPKKTKPITQESQEAVIQLLHSSNGLKDNDILTLEDNNVLDETSNLINDKLKETLAVEKNIREKHKANQVRNGEKLDDDDGIDSETLILNGNVIKVSQERKLEPQVSSKRKLDVTLFDDDDDDEVKQPKKEIKMKKLKKKKESKQRVKQDDEDINLQSVHLNPVEIVEDDIHLSLSAIRSLKQQKRSAMTPEDIAREIRTLSRIDQENELEKETMKGIVYDQTSEFLSSIEPQEVQQEPEPTSEYQEQEIIEEQGSGESGVPVPGDVAPTPVNVAPAPVGSIGLVLSYLDTAKTANVNSKTNRETLKLLELNKIKISIEERILKENLAKDPHYNKLSKDDQEEVFSRKLDQVLEEKNIKLPQIHNYKPSVELKYKNDQGQEINSKQAYKVLSSQFHGTKSRTKEEKKKRQKK